MKSKNNHIVMIMSSVVCLLPLILSFVMYHDLPEQIAIQWNNTGEQTNVIPKSVAAFGLPFILMVINIISKHRLQNDPKQEGASTVMRGVYCWLIPFISLVAVPAMLFMAMDVSIPITIIAPLGIGLLFILFGNYLPKNRQNNVIGIKLPWTHGDTDNWNKTHRFAGYVWIMGGVTLIASSFMLYETPAWRIMSLAMIVLMVVVPMFYSYSLSKRNNNRKLGSTE